MQWKIGIGWIAALKADVSALGVDPEDVVARVAYTLLILAAPFAIAEWTRRVLRRHGDGKSNSEQEGFCASIQRWETTRFANGGWRAFRLRAFAAWLLVFAPSLALRQGGAVFLLTKN